MRDRQLRDELLFEARASGAETMAEKKAMVREAVRLTRMLDWREAGSYARRLESLADRLRQWLASPDAMQVVELSELAIKGAERSLEMIDDSNRLVLPAILGLVELHRHACEQVQPDPVSLAERLFNFQIDGEWGIFDDVWPGYQKALGATGLARYRELIADAWHALPALSASLSDKHSVDWRRMQLERAMVSLASAAGDGEALIRIYAHDLSSPYRYLQLAQISAEHGCHGDALSWALRGIEVFGDLGDDRLLRFCIDEYLRRGERERANEFAWRCFERAAGAAEFGRLMTVAKATDSSAALRERALRHLWEFVRQEESGSQTRLKMSPRAWQVPARSELVQIFLAEGSADAAWQAFCGGAVVRRLWTAMAEARGRSHPQDALELYRQLLPEAVKAGTAGARYEEAVEIVRCIGSLRKRMAQEAEFAAELLEIRSVYRAKRNFIKLLDEGQRDGWELC